jgi:hypothetical protein
VVGLPKVLDGDRAHALTLNPPCDGQ